LAREDEPGNKRLIAYVVSNQQPEFSVSELELPQGEATGYMVPSAFVRLKALPLTPNGRWIVERSQPTALNQSWKGYL